MLRASVSFRRQLTDLDLDASSTEMFAWYCFVGTPLVCCICCLICRYRERQKLAMEQLRVQQEVQARTDISRMEANVKVFTENESYRRKQSIRKTMKRNITILTAQDIRACQRVGKTEESLAAESSSSEVCYTQSTLELSRFNLQLSQGCSICLESFVEGDAVMHADESSNCRHLYHRDCAVSFLATQTTSLCPCCRQPFGSGDTPSTSLSSNEQFHQAFGVHRGESERHNSEERV